MESEQNHRDGETNGVNGPEPFEEEKYVVPGAQIVRASTVRPVSLGVYGPDTGKMEAHIAPPVDAESLAAFPVIAPSAPPLPEECDEELDVVELAMGATPLPVPSSEPEEAMVAPEFAWLFEYGLEMDEAVLNGSPDLDGLMLLYGPAVLKGYKLTFDVLNRRGGKVVATIVPSRERHMEVWGVLYRVPRSLLEARDDGAAPLDALHCAAPPEGLFERVEVAVHELYRQREVTCFTYMASASARNLFHLLPRRRQVIDAAYMQRLLQAGREHKLPDEYLQELAAEVQHDMADAGDTTVSRVAVVAQKAEAAQSEQNTEPLSVLGEQTDGQAQDSGSALPAASEASDDKGEQAVAKVDERRGKLIFAYYLAALLVVVLVMAVLQGVGIGDHLFVSNFTSLDVPWFVLVYGLLGGCISCIVRLGWRDNTQHHPTDFVLVTWFMRPFIGAILAVIVYLLLNTGLVAPGGSSGQREILFALLATLAGACEGWLF